MINIRKLTPEDVERVLGLFEASAANTKGVLANLKDFMLCESGSEILGCGCGIVKDNEVFVNCVLVKEASRRDKIGSAIVKAILNQAELNGAKKAYMLTSVPQLAEYLKFDRMSEGTVYKEKQQFFIEAYNGNLSGAIYFANLEGYFKPCCCK